MELDLNNNEDFLWMAMHAPKAHQKGARRPPVGPFCEGCGARPGKHTQKNPTLTLKAGGEYIVSLVKRPVRLLDGREAGLVDLCENCEKRLAAIGAVS